MIEQYKIATKPNFAEEQRLAEQGYSFIAGIDEVGRGPLAGPVVAAAVILPANLGARWLTLVRDSKQLTAKRRESLSPLIAKAAIGIGIGLLPPDAIDAYGIVKATRLAMCAAVDHLPCSPDFLLIDYLKLPELDVPQKSITKGDSLSLSIACASIVAKVARDRLMVKLDKVYAGYKLAQHKGYCTGEHVACLHRLGPSPIHRYSFHPVRELI